jgi:hypothetical protein
MGTLGSNEVDVDLIWNLPFCPLKPSRSQSMQSARQGKDKDLQNRGGNCRSQNLILGNLCLMSAPVAVVNHHCTLACPKMACMLRPINPVVLSPPLNKCNSGSNCRGFLYGNWTVPGWFCGDPLLHLIRGGESSDKYP